MNAPRVATYPTNCSEARGIAPDILILDERDYPSDAVLMNILLPLLSTENREVFFLTDDGVAGREDAIRHYEKQLNRVSRL